MIFATSKLLFRVIGALTIALAIIVGLGAWRLSTGPISLAFLTPYFEEALSNEAQGFRIRLADTVLTWAGWRRTVDLRIVKVRLERSDGVVVASVPEMSLSFSARALLDGTVAPTSLDLIGARLQLRRSPDGRLALRLVDRGDEAASELLPTQLSTLLEPPSRRGALGYLSRVSILGGELTVEDSVRGVAWRAPDADIVLFRDASGVHGTMNATLDVGSYRTHVDMVGRYTAATGQTALEISSDEVRPDRIAALLPDVTELRAMQLPVGGRVTIGIDATGTLTEAGFDINGGAGVLSFPEIFPGDLKIKNLKAVGRVDTRAKSVVIERLFVDTVGPNIDVSGSLLPRGQGFVVKADVVARDVAANELKHYWPRNIGPHPRNWTIKNLRDGVYHEVRAAVSGILPASGDLDLGGLTAAGELTFSGITLDYLDGLPPVVGVEGTAKFTEERMDFSVTGGQLAGLKLQEGVVAITDLDKIDQWATIEAVFDGPLADILGVIDRPPLEFAKTMALTPTQIGGSAAVRLNIKLPLAVNLKLADVQIGAQANLHDVSIPDIITGHDLEQASLQLSVDKTRLAIDGLGQLAGLPVVFNGVENFSENSPFRRRFRITGNVDHKVMQRLGVDLEPYVRGPMRVKATMVDRLGESTSLAIDFNLINAVLTLPQLNWAKPPDKPGRALLQLRVRGEKLEAVRALAVDAGGLLITGRGDYDTKNNRLRGIKLTKAILGAKNDLRADIRIGENGQYDVRLAGTRFNAAPLMDRLHQETEQAGPAVTVSARLDQVWISDDGPPLSKVDATFRFEKGQLRETKIVGQSGAAGKVNLTLKDAGKTRELAVLSDDAGGVLNSLGIIDTVVGGGLEIAAKIDDSAPSLPTAGRIEMKDFRVVRAPVLARLLAAASLTGISDALSADKGLAFSRAVVPFSLADGRVTFEPSRAYGSAVGLTFKGVVDLGRQNVDIDGTLVPAYTVNRVLGGIPILGTILTGGEGSGLFAATYTMTGPRDAPKVTVNPLSALAPGYLRNLFGIFDGTDAPAPPKGAPKKRPTTE